MRLPVTFNVIHTFKNYLLHIEKTRYKIFIIVGKRKIEEEEENMHRHMQPVEITTIIRKTKRKRCLLHAISLLRRSRWRWRYSICNKNLPKLRRKRCKSPINFGALNQYQKWVNI